MIGDLVSEVSLGAIVGYAWFLLVATTKRDVPLFGGPLRASVNVGFVAVAIVVAHFTAKNFVGGLAVGWAVTEGPRQTLFDAKKPPPSPPAPETIDSKRDLKVRLRSGPIARAGRWFYYAQ